MELSDLETVNRQQIRRAGARYTPGLDPDAPNVEVEELARTFAFLGSHRSRRAHLRSHKTAIEERIRWLPRSLEREFRGRKFTPEYVASTLDRLSAAEPGDYKAIATELSRAVRIVDRALRRVANRLYQQELDAASDEARGRLRDEQDRVSRVFEPLVDVREFVESPSFSVLSANSLLVLGAWGTGKTHSLCDLVEYRMRERLPTLFYLASGLPSGRNPLAGLCEATGLAQNPFALLQHLQRLGESSGCRALLVVDAVNEGDREAWSRALPSILREVRKLSHVGLVVSCRRPFDQEMFNDRNRSGFVRIEHRGFTDIEVDAQVAFFTYYGIPAAQVPLLTPEFSRPLFLKVVCESLKGRSQRHRSEYLRQLASGQKGMTLVLEDFAKAMGRPIEREFGLPPLACWRLLKGDSLDGEMQLGIAPAMAHSLREAISRDECLDLIARFTSWASRARCEELLQRLAADGLLVESMTWTDGRNVPVVQLPYQRFADHLVARHLLDRHLEVATETSLRRSFYVNRPLGRVFDLARNGRSYLHAGLASAIMLEFPERVKRSPLPPDDRELVLYLPRARRLVGPLQEAFFEGLYWRPSDSFSTQTDRIISFYLNGSNERVRRDVLEVLVGLATRAGHPHSARRLYERIQSMDMAERDLFWSEFVRKAYSDSAVFRLLDWIERTQDRPRDAEVVENCVLLLSLFLTTTRRALRDRATRALFLLGLEHPAALFEHTVESLDFNDPYVPERLLAASYGVAMSTWADRGARRVRKSLPLFARVLLKRMLLPRGRNGTAHVLMQGYALGIIELARRIAPRCVSAKQATYLDRPLRAVRSPFPNPATIDDAVVEDAESALHMDFENYTLGRLVPGRGNYQFEHAGYQEVRRQVLWRIHDLGYSDETFRSADIEIVRSGALVHERDPSRVDRYGKKYSWIAFFEAYGVRLDVVPTHVVDSREAGVRPSSAV